MDAPMPVVKPEPGAAPGPPDSYLALRDLAFSKEDLARLRDEFLLKPFKVKRSADGVPNTLKLCRLKHQYGALWAALTDGGRDADGRCWAPADLLWALRCLEHYESVCHRPGQDALPGNLQALIGAASEGVGPRAARAPRRAALRSGLCRMPEALPVDGDVGEGKEVIKVDLTHDEVDVEALVIDVLFLREVKAEPGEEGTAVGESRGGHHLGHGTAVATAAVKQESGGAATLREVKAEPGEQGAAGDKGGDAQVGPSTAVVTAAVKEESGGAAPLREVEAEERAEGAGGKGGGAQVGPSTVAAAAAVKQEPEGAMAAKRGPEGAVVAKEEEEEDEEALAAEVATLERQWLLDLAEVAANVKWIADRLEERLSGGRVSGAAGPPPPPPGRAEAASQIHTGRVHGGQGAARKQHDGLAPHMHEGSRQAKAEGENGSGPCDTLREVMTRLPGGMGVIAQADRLTSLQQMGSRSGATWRPVTKRDDDVVCRGWQSDLAELERCRAGLKRRRVE